MSAEIKADLLKEIRDRIHYPDKVPSILEGLSDADLWNVYAMLRGGSNNVEVARYLIDKGLLSCSSDSGRKLVEKLKRKLLPFLTAPVQAPRKEIIPPLEPMPEDVTPGMDEVRDIDLLCKRYRRIIDRELCECEGGAALSQVLSRHIAALSGLIKTNDKLRSDLLREHKSSRWGLSVEEREQAEALSEHFSDGGKIMLAATKKFLALAAKRAIKLDDPITKKIIQ